MRWKEESAGGNTVCSLVCNSPSSPLFFPLTAADYQEMISNAQKLPSQHMKGNTIRKLLTYDFVPLIDVVSAWE
jgi:hypothetical protein